MQLQTHSRLLEEHENHMRKIITKTEAGKGIGEVYAVGELSAKVVEGRHTGYVINAFAWVCPNESGDGDVIKVTDCATGYGLATIPIGIASQGTAKFYRPSDEEYEKMLPAMMHACEHAAFFRFKQAEDEAFNEMVWSMESLPRIDEMSMMH